MLKSIVLNGKRVEYTLTYKDVKNINIRVKCDLTVSVSAPKRTKEKQVIAFIEQSADFILSTLDRYASLPKKPDIRLISGEKIYYLGKPKDLVVLEGKPSVVVSEDSLFLTVKNPNGFDEKNKVLSRWLGKECQRVVSRLCEEVYQEFKSETGDFPDIKFRNMRSGWGNCRPNQNRLTFAYMLIKAPLECIKYVVYHEFTHFLVFNHSKKFYGKLSVFCPDYKQLKNKLKDYQ